MKAVVTVVITFDGPVTKASVKRAVLAELNRAPVEMIAHCPPSKDPHARKFTSAQKVTVRNVDID